MDYGKGLPKRVKLGGKVMPIQPITMEQVKEKGYWGAFFEDPRMELCVEQTSAANVLDTLMHELYHAIFAEWNIQDHDDEERIVHTLASAMQAILLDNQHLLNYINKLNKQVRIEHNEEEVSNGKS